MHKHCIKYALIISASLLLIISCMGWRDETILRDDCEILFVYENQTKHKIALRVIGKETWYVDEFIVEPYNKWSYSVRLKKWDLSYDYDAPSEYALAIDDMLDVRVDRITEVKLPIECQISAVSYSYDTVDIKATKKKVHTKVLTFTFTEEKIQTYLSLLNDK